MTVEPPQWPAIPAENAPLDAARRSRETLELLARRRSTKIALLTEPGPSAGDIDALLRLAARVPDHGVLGPWRFAVIAGDARARLSAALANIVKNDPDMTEERLAIERRRFLRAPACVMVISAPTQSKKAPEWEQTLSAGAAAFSLLLGAHAMGYAGAWLTEWPAYDERARAALGLAADEKIAGFVYLGTASQPLTERARAALRVTWL